MLHRKFIFDRRPKIQARNLLELFHIDRISDRQRPSLFLSLDNPDTARRRHGEADVESELTGAGRTN
jgi:hypothetical protein